MTKHIDYSSESPTAVMFREYSKDNIPDALEASAKLTEPISQESTAEPLKNFSSSLSKTLDSLHSIVSQEFSESLEIARQKLLESFQSKADELRDREAALLVAIEQLGVREKGTVEQNIKRGALLVAIEKSAKVQHRRQLLKTCFKSLRNALNLRRSSKTSQKLVSKLYSAALLRKVLLSWHQHSRLGYVKTIEKKLEKIYEYREVVLLAEQSAKLDALTHSLQKAREELDVERRERGRMSEEYKGAFLRGVSALNAQAVGMFHGEIGLAGVTPAYFDRGATTKASVTSYGAIKGVLVESCREETPGKSDFTKSTAVTEGECARKYDRPSSRSNVVTSTNGLVTRHYNPPVK